MPHSPTLFISTLKRLIAGEINRHARYFSVVIQIYPLAHDEGELLGLLRAPKKERHASLLELGEVAEGNRLFFLHGVLNHHLDVEQLLRAVKEKMQRGDRLTATIFNSYWRALYALSNRFGWRKGDLPTTFLTQTALENLARLAGFEIVRSRPVGFIPGDLWGIGNILNRVLASIPLLRWVAIAEVVTFRPLLVSAEKPTLSIVVPARNERGNIPSLLKRIPEFSGTKVEVIFIEGHSTDGTWEEILKIQREHKRNFEISAHQQKGIGKADAARLGISLAKHDLLVILDADLSMPPELLPRFYEAYLRGDGDFINGSRLVYPMEGGAMRYLNWLGNVFFAKSLSFVLEHPIGDSLCGTKLFSRVDAARFRRWREDFGDFDPFGDYELLFPAAVLGLGMIDIPVRYRARTYGTTNIHRFKDGLRLLKMTAIGLCRIRA